MSCRQQLPRRPRLPPGQRRPSPRRCASNFTTERSPACVHAYAGVRLYTWLAQVYSRLVDLPQLALIVCTKTGSMSDVGVETRSLWALQPSGKEVDSSDCVYSACCCISVACTGQSVPVQTDLGYHAPCDRKLNLLARLQAPAAKKAAPAAKA